MSSITTAKVIVTSNRPTPDGEQHTVSLGADYNDGRNKEWAKYTPGLSIQITVLPEVAERFPVGQAFELRFVPED